MNWNSSSDRSVDVVCRSFASEEGKLRFAHDIELTLSESQQLGFDPDYINAILGLLDKLKDLEIDDKEYAILCAIILFYEGLSILSAHLLQRELSTHQ